MYITFFLLRDKDVELCEVDNTSEKAMAPHSSTLAWKIPWMEGPGGLDRKSTRLNSSHL